MKIPVTTHYLEMNSPRDLRPAQTNAQGFAVRQILPPNPKLNRDFYIAVGGGWHWVDRLVWSEEKWAAYANRPELETWVGYVGETPVGYFEMESQAEDNIELAYFGLLPQFIGKGLGGALLTSAIERAWQMGARRVWVHTCTRDHPSALANYQARGFRQYKEETSDEEL